MVDQALCSARGQEGGIGGVIRAAEPREAGLGLQGAVLLSPCPSLVPRYEVQLGDSLLSMSGCSLECWKDVVQKACCPGYWGSQCYGMEVGGSQPCSSHPRLPACPFIWLI